VKKKTEQSKVTSANSLSAFQTSEFPRRNGDHCTHRREEVLNIFLFQVGWRNTVFSERKQRVGGWREKCCEITEAKQKHEIAPYTATYPFDMNKTVVKSW